MKTQLTMKYLVLPVNTCVSSKKVCLYADGTLLFDFDCKIDLLEPNFTAFVDVSRFAGRTVDIVVEPDMDFVPGFSDTMRLPHLFSDSLRPQVHFTVKNGWNNDPNGLIFYRGMYHMFYQFNPMAAEWGNMHWGHAVSPDLLHWEERDPALYPDALGTVFSGSAIEDIEGRAGFGCGTMLLYYTAAGGNNRISNGQRFTQCLAYSTDGGVTFEKYAGNPILPHIEAANRDPKVVWVEELGKYVMALYLVDGRYKLLTSEDLLHWTHLQEIAFHADAECPDLFCLTYDGKRFWILMGASDTYIVGRFKDGCFQVLGEDKKWNYLKMSYAAQSFSGIPDGRVVRIAWHRLNIPAPNFTQQMGFPVELHLEKEQDQYYLAAEPIREIESLYIDGQTVPSEMLTETRSFEIGMHPLDILLRAPYTPGKKLTLTLFGAKLICDMEQNQVVYGKKTHMPLSLSRQKLELRILVDRCSVEVFADGGKFFFADKLICDYNLPRIILDPGSVPIEYFSYHILNSALPALQ